MYDTFQEAEQKLAGTIVGYDGQPFYIHGAIPCDPRTPIAVTAAALPKGSPSQALLLSDPKWELNNLGSRLGYTNLDWREYHQAVYTRRVPVRSAQRTQGLSHQNVRITKIVPNKRLGLPGTQITFQSLTQNPGFASTWDGKYLSMSAVKRDMGRLEVVSRAFGKHLAIQKSSLGMFYLMYKGEAIGYSDDLEVFVVPKQFRYLDELLIEDHNLKVK